MPNPVIVPRSPARTSRRTRIRARRGRAAPLAPWGLSLALVVMVIGGGLALGDVLRLIGAGRGDPVRAVAAARWIGGPTIPR